MSTEEIASYITGSRWEISSDYANAGSFDAKIESGMLKASYHLNAWSYCQINVTITVVKTAKNAFHCWKCLNSNGAGGAVKDRHIPL